MKLVRSLGITVLVLTGAGLVFFSGPRASGQSAKELPQPILPSLVPLHNGPYGNLPILYGPGGHDPEMLKLLTEEAKSEREAVGLVKEFARTENEGERAKIKAKLSDLLGKEFDVQQQRRDLELVRLEAQVKKLRELMKKRSDARQTIVEKRLDQLTREAEGLGWTAPPGLVPQGLPQGGSFQAR